jgi:nicotinate-nucleotide pyrophosphorylase (carboxylating)
VKIDPVEIKQTVNRALAEDIGSGDVTSQAVIGRREAGRGKVISKASGVLAGTAVAKLVFETVDKKVKVKVKMQDGALITKGKVILEISGPARSILAAERTALNFLQRMSGIATLTREFVDKVKGTGGKGLGTSVKILATRKTAPGLRVLDKYAVTVGGGMPHRMGLYDAVLIKENHVDIAGSLKNAVRLARKRASKRMAIEVEARNLSEVRDAIGAGADTILFDNMSVPMLRRAVKLVKSSSRKIKTEASGGVDLNNVSKIARTGVDSISVGALTHSPKALDMSLEI